MNAETEEEFLEYKSVEKKFTDTDIKEIIEKEIKIDVLMQLPIEKRNKYN